MKHKEDAKPQKEPKCKGIVHVWGRTFDSRYEKCHNCNLIRKKQ